MTSSTTMGFTEDSKDLCSFDLDYSYMSGINQSYVSRDDYALCVTMVGAEDVLSFIFLHLMLIPVLILVLITLFGKDQEEYKWFVFHTALLNLTLGIIWKGITFWPSATFLWVLLNYNMNLSVISIFPLAFTRFFFLYFRYEYERIFAKKYIIFWIMIFDLITIGLLYLDSLGTTHIISIVVDSILIISTIVCSVLIFIKIRSMAQLFHNKHHQNSYKDLHRAAFVCALQGCIISLHLANTIYCTIFMDYLVFDGSMFDPFYKIYMVLAPMQNPLYQVFIIIDSLVTLILLKSYRIVLIRVYRKVFKRFPGGKITVVQPITRVTILTGK